MNTIDSVLNGIYCLSQEASSTVTNLRLYPHILKNSDSYKLYELLEELHSNTLEAFKDMKLDLLETCLNVHLKEIFSRGHDLEDIYGTFINTISLPVDHILVRKLQFQINNLLLMIIKLSQVSSKIKTFNTGNFMAH